MAFRTSDSGPKSSIKLAIFTHMSFASLKEQGIRKAHSLKSDFDTIVDQLN